MDDTTVKPTKYKPNEIEGVYFGFLHKAWTAEILTHDRLIRLCRTKDYFEACCQRKSAELKYNIS